MLAIRGAVRRCLVELILLYISVRLAVATIVMWIMFWFPSLKAKIVETVKIRTQMPTSGGGGDVTGRQAGGGGDGVKWSNYNMPVENWQDTLVTWSSYRAICRSVALDLRKTACVGQPAVDCPVVRLEDGSTERLLDHERSGRPLVLVFGSCS
jgi:hypothetical protein